MAQNADLSVTDFSKAVKNQWPQARLTRRTLEANPLVAMLPIKNFSGLTLFLVINYAGQQGRSADFAKAVSGRTASKQKGFNLTTVKDYAVGGIDGETLDTIEDVDSLIDGIDKEMDTCFETMDRSIAVHVFGDGSGSIGRVGEDTSGTSFKLSNKYDAVNFAVGQTLIRNPNKTGNAGTIGAGTGEVTGVDMDTGLITFTASGGWNPAVDDYIYVDGDYDEKMSGLAAWFPETAPTSGDSFFSVDRSVHPTKLAGHRFDGSAMLPEEAISKALSHAGSFSCRPDLIVVHPMDYHAMKQSLGSKAIIDLAKSPNDPQVSFESLVFVNGNKKVKVIEDHGCPKAVAYGLNTKTIAIYARKKRFPGILDRDGNKMRADASADSYLWRLGFYAQLGCEDPGGNLRIKLPTT
jgi:hypothetical protein